MIRVEEAVRLASEYLRNLFPMGHDFLLEEIELESQGGWFIALSFVLPGQTSPTTTTIDPRNRQSFIDPAVRTTIGVDPNRIYKLVEIGPDGQVRAVRMRPIAVG